MKIGLPILFFSLLGAILLEAQAPLVLSLENYNLDMDGIAVIPGQADFGVPAIPQTGPAQTWDYGNLFGANIAMGHFWVDGDLCFAQTDRRAITSVPNLGIQSEWLYSVEETGIRTLGLNQLNTVAGLPGGGTLEWQDTCQLFPEEQYWLPFPTTYEGKWLRDITEVHPFSINLPGLFDDVDGVFVRRNFVADTVTAWGQVTIPTAQGPQSFEALLVERDLFQLDSFFLENQPAPDTLLAILGREQGAMLLQKSYTFRSNANEILLSIATDIFDNILGFSYLSDPEIVSGNEEVGRATKIQVFPNPTSGSITFQSESPVPQNSVVEIYDGLGRKVWSQTLLTTSRQDITLPLPPSSYYLFVKDQNGKTIYQTVLAKH